MLTNKKAMKAASILAKEKYSVDMSRDRWTTNVLTWADYFTKHVKGFNRAKFYTACGFGE